MDAFFCGSTPVAWQKSTRRVLKEEGGATESASIPLAGHELPFEVLEYVDSLGLIGGGGSKDTPNLMSNSAYQQ